MFSTLTNFLNRLLSLAGGFDTRRPSKAASSRSEQHVAAAVISVTPHCALRTAHSNRAPLFRPFLIAAPQATKRASDLFLLFGITALALAAGGAVAQEATSAPAVATDQSTYTPWTTVSITGANFQAGESVQIEIDGQNTDGTWTAVATDPSSANPITVSADDNGSFVAAWYVYNTNFAGVALRANATGA